MAICGIEYSGKLPTEMINIESGGAPTLIYVMDNGVVASGISCGATNQHEASRNKY
jgi:hypothetical protein